MDNAGFPWQAGALALPAEMLQKWRDEFRQTSFSRADHDHGRCTADGIAHAMRICEARAQKFTPIRRQVLEALLSATVRSAPTR